MTSIPILSPRERAKKGTAVRDIGQAAPKASPERAYNEGESMPTYIALLKWTPQGLQNLKASPSRLDAARKSLENSGVMMKDFYMVTGRYDMVAIAVAPDEGVMARALLSITSKGDFTSETCRAFTEEEYRQIIGGLP